MSSNSNVQTRQLGKNGPVVPRLGLGCVPLGGGAYGLAASDEDRLAFLDEAYKLGARFWDVADEYADAEDVIGKWITANPEKREDVVIGTKFGIVSDPVHRRAFGTDSSPEYCRKAIEKSLSRLAVSYVDIYYIHRVDKVTPVEKTMEALVELKNQGKIKHIGISECSASTLRRAHAIHPITCVQVEYSLICKAIETPEVPILETARELGIAIVAYGPLGSGLLSGSIQKREDITKPGDLRAMIPALRDENFDSNLAIVGKISDLAKSKGATTGQLALAWLLAQGDDIFPIPGTSSARRLKENFESMSISVSPEEDQILRELAGGIVGQRVQELLGHAFADSVPL
ncbi:hypothetical protein S40293_05947 [Stachybotrys chartarum IBT 40293]|nr:hypothetical protein S40293_05947 [Stachybotrys chartarum IBT 40293]